MSRPVAQKLKAAYEAAQKEEDDLLNSSDNKPTETLGLKASSCAQLAEFVKGATDDEQTEPPLHEKVSSHVDSLLLSGLNKPALLIQY